jgi:hypothetical protein
MTMFNTPIRAAAEAGRRGVERMVERVERVEMLRGVLARVDALILELELLRNDIIGELEGEEARVDR